MIVAVLIAIGVGATVWWLDTRGWVSTDDAFIAVHMVEVAPQVPGRVARVFVGDDEEVTRGQPLVQIDAAGSEAKLDQAQANQASAKGTLGQARAQRQVTEANLAETQAQVGVAKANAENATINLRRVQALARMHSMALSQQQLDNAIAASRSANANLAAAQRKVVAARAQVAYADTQVETAKAGVRAAAAQVEQAKLDLSYTTIRAPVAGHIAHKNVAAGNYVQVGQDLMALVPNNVWVTANFKETEIGEIRPGAPADINIDAYPGKVFHGRVASIQSGAGAAFSLLPAENATGNFVKVVQRVPVKIVFSHMPGPKYVLGPGMSAVPYVRIIR